MGAHVSARGSRARNAIGAAPAAFALAAALLTTPASAQVPPQHQAISGLAPPAAAEANGQFRVVTVASPLPDAINMHIVETPQGLVLFDALRRSDQVEEALRVIERLGKQPVALLLTHAHTDHYGGVAFFRRRFPDLPVYASAAVTRAMRDDPNGDNRRRRELFGARFPTQAEITANLPTHEVADGRAITIAGLTITPMVMGASESLGAAVYLLPQLEAAITGDLVNVLTVPAPFESLDEWLRQLDRIEAGVEAGARLHVGHGPSGPAAPLIAEQRAYLSMLRAGVVAALASDGRLTKAEREALARDLRFAFPHYRGAALLPPDELTLRGIDAVAEQLSARRQPRRQ